MNEFDIMIENAIYFGCIGVDNLNDISTLSDEFPNKRINCTEFKQLDSKSYQTQIDDARASSGSGGSSAQCNDKVLGCAVIDR